MSALTDLTIVGARAALEAREFSARELTEAHVQAAEAARGLNALVAETFDLAMGAFGVRNFGDIPSGLAEAYRVLKPGGEILVLDFCQPTTPLFRQLYQFYFHRVLPLVGGLISGQRQAYAYLPRSVGEFPQGQAFVDLLDAVGFAETGYTPMTLGISAIYQGVKRPVD